MLFHSIKITEAALMQLCLMNVDQYLDPIEFEGTYGLLWGNISSDDYNTYYRIDHVVTAAKSLQDSKSVYSAENNIAFRKNFANHRWPDISFIGDIRIYPYDSTSGNDRWKLREADRRRIEYLETEMWSELDFKVSLVLSADYLIDTDWEFPRRLCQGNSSSAELINTVEWMWQPENMPSDKYRLRLAAYVINSIEVEM